MSGRLFVYTHASMPTSATAIALGQLIPDGFAVRLSLIESTVVELEVTRQNTGWQILFAESHRFVALAWSPSGRFTDARLEAIGRLAEIPGDLLSQKQTLRYLCSPLDVESRMLAFARANLDTSPQVDWLIADASPSDPEAYLAGRSRVYRVDPVTHEVSTYDEIVGDRIIDLSGTALVGDGRISDKPGIYDPPVGTLRAVVRVDWEQSASGEVDIGSRIFRVDSLDPNLGSNLQGHVVFRNGEGWSATGGEAQTRKLGEHTVDVGSRYRVERSIRARETVFVRNPNGAAKETEVTLVAPVNVDYPASRTQPVETGVHPALRKFRHERISFPMSFSYTQPRAETLYAALECPLPIAIASAGDDEREEADFEFTVSDVMVDPSIPEYEVGVQYRVGMQVRRSDRYYECLADHEGEYFEQVRADRPPTETNRTYWKQVFPDLPTPATLTRFFDSERGEMLRRHILLRLRKEALRRLRMRHVVLTYRWQDAAHVRLEDSVRFLIPWGDGTLRAVVGKVFSIEKTWDGLSQPLITIEAAVSFGTSELVPERFEILSEPVSEMDEPSPPSVPVEAHRLVSLNYAATMVRVLNDAGEQLSRAASVVASGKRIEDVSVEYPTTIEIEMRPIQTTGTLERDFDVVASLEDAPRGIQL